jgi:tetratricopeptide (TPR) repeat protein
MQITIGKSSYTISFKSKRSAIKEWLKEADLKNYLELYELAKENPKKALTPLEELYKNHPTVPPITSLLTYVYIRRRKLKSAESLIEKNYTNNPSNFFARINYADQCLRKKRPERIPEIFNNTFEIKELYPNQTTYHYSEISSFATLMSFYHLMIRQKEKALDYYRIAVQVDPEAKSLIHLEKKLFSKSRIHSLITKFQKIVKTH